MFWTPPRTIQDSRPLVLRTLRTTTCHPAGTLEKAQQLTNHQSARTTKLYDRRDDKLSLDEVERITI